jgi:hypothetical protein
MYTQGMSILRIKLVGPRLIPCRASSRSIAYCINVSAQQSSQRHALSLPLAHQTISSYDSASNNLNVSAQKHLKGMHFPSP